MAKMSLTSAGWQVTLSSHNGEACCKLLYSVYCANIQQAVDWTGTHLYRMNKTLTKNKNDNFERRHADLRLQVEERFQHLFQVDLDYCARHSATCQQTRHLHHQLDDRSKQHEQKIHILHTTYTSSAITCSGIDNTWTQMDNTKPGIPQARIWLSRARMKTRTMIKTYGITSKQS